MSKVVMSLPKGMVRRSLIGGAVALAVYVALQFLLALLLHREVVGEELLYPMVCISAALASFCGCVYSLLAGQGSPMLSVSVVVVVFLAVTAAVGLLTAEALSVERGLTGVGLSMAAGGLAASLVGSLRPSKSAGSRSRVRKRRGR